MTISQPLLAHRRPIGVDADRLPERVLVREIDKAHAHHEHEQVPHVALARDVAAARDAAAAGFDVVDIKACHGFLFAFDTVVISGAERTIQDLWQLSPAVHGVAMASALSGTVLGAMLGGWLTDSTAAERGQATAFDRPTAAGRPTGSANSRTASRSSSRRRRRRSC